MTRAGPLAVTEPSPWVAGRPWALKEAERERRIRVVGELAGFEVVEQKTGPVVEPAEFDLASQ